MRSWWGSGVLTVATLGGPCCEPGGAGGVFIDGMGVSLRRGDPTDGLIHSGRWSGMGWLRFTQSFDELLRSFVELYFGAVRRSGGEATGPGGVWVRVSWASVVAAPDFGPALGDFFGGGFGRSVWLAEVGPACAGVTRLG